MDGARRTRCIYKRLDARPPMTETISPRSTSSTRVPLGASLMALGAGLCWSLGALFARLAESTDAWQYLFWRSIGVLVVMETMAIVRHQPLMLMRAYTSGMVMIGGCVGLFVASLAFVYALKNTGAANAAFLASLTPLVAVVLSRIFLGERLNVVTVAAIALALVGLLVMVTAELGAGNMVGNVSAMLSSVGFAAYTVCIRSAPNVDWSPVLPGYAFMMMVICGAVTVSNSNTLLPPPSDIGWAFAHGALVIVIGTLLYNVASRTVPAVAMTVFAQTETVFIPIWVFVWFSEIPTTTTLIGGALILTAVVGKAILDAR